MKVLVTGANGFVGKALCQKLIEAKHQLRAISRYPAPTFQKGDAVEWIQIPNIDGDTDWSDARLKDINTIIHLASRVHVIKENESDPKAAFMGTNRDGTKHLAEQAIAAGVKRFIFISTAHVHGHLSGDAPFKEDSPALPHSDYAESKWQAEEELRKLFSKKDVSTELVIIRPPLVYGPDVKANFERLLWLVNKQIPLPIKKIDNRRSLIFVENLADFILVCTEKKKIGNQTFLISDGEDISTPTLLEKLAEIMGKRSLQIPLKPEWLFKAAKKLKIERQVDSLCANLQLDISHAQSTLKWNAPITQDEGLKQTTYFYQRSLNIEN